MTQGVVAAGHEVTARAARDILAEDGNAFDAVLAAMLAACVAEPVLASLGGGGFLLAHPADGEPLVFDFFVQTPRHRRPLEEIDFRPILADFGTAQQEFHIGVGTIATPGVPAGLQAVHQTLCRMPLARIAEPAIKAAAEGVTLNGFQHTIAAIVAPILESSPAALALHAPAEDPLRLALVGECVRNPGLADALDLLCREGADFFYRGEPARLLTQHCREHGGWLTADDLCAYRAQRRPPLIRDYGGHRVFLNPPPSIGGALLSFSLALLDPAQSAAAGISPGTIARVMAQTQLARRAHDVDFGLDDPMAADLLGADTLARYRAALAGALSTRGTTHISVADRKGNIASLTLSNGEGCGYVLPGTGIMLNNMLGEEDLNACGFHQWTPDRRVASMMSPTLLHSLEGDWYAIGSGGSNRIRSAILQVTLNLLQRGMSLQEATRSPRIHLEADHLHIEAGLPAEALSALQTLFPSHRLWPDINLYFGGTHTVVRRADASVEGAGDPRRGGIVLYTA